MNSDAPAKWREFFRYHDDALGKDVWREHRVPCHAYDKSKRTGTGAEMLAAFAERLGEWVLFDFIGRWQFKQIDCWCKI